MPEPSTHIDQATTLRRLATASARSTVSGSAYCWTVTSGKGGVGKSVVALNFAIALADSGRSVLLVDADENLGKLDLMVGASPKRRMADVLSGSVTIADAAITVRPNLLLLPGSSGSTNYPDITAHERTAFIASARTAIPGITDVVFDTAAGIQEKVTDYASASDQVIIVSHHEPVAIIDAYAVIKMINARRADVPVSVIMNKSNSATECDEAAVKLQTAVNHFLGREVRYLGIIPNDPAVGRSIVAQKPVALFAPASPATLCLRSITNALIQRSTPQYHQEAIYA